MRVIIIILLLIVLGFIGWKAAERFKIIDSPQEQSSEQSTEVPATEEPAEQATEPALPSFDVVRVDRTGYAVIAGRAKPGSEVTIYANDEVLEKVEAERDGSWVISTDTPLDAGPVELSLSMKTGDGTVIRSEDTILIYVPEREGDIPLVLRTTPGGATEVLQDPREAGPGLGPLSLDVIDYDDTGAVIFSGRADPGRVVQLFINRQLIGQVAADEDGNWMIAPEIQVEPGVYQLLVIQLDEEGRPEYAIELPFERASADQIQLRDGKVIVQPGNSLWRIARRAYGRGAQYTIIYEANADQIRDPDLIYPGQIFEVPTAEDEETE
ncbi:LysM peptidoglycan-binding domain-containing protein [Hyphococcus sp. DH-69]|uniref:LysM peptidoglycan-binding domain-containing protein n=1 Tax=Hyphococcus formosus TaxID=3143534 RepID=UPI00398A6ED4